MRIYTRTGDEGETGLIGGERVSKDAARVEAFGTVDELNAHLGFARSLLQDPELDAVLARAQNDLFDLGADLATPSKRRRTADAPRASSTSPEQVARLEQEIDRLQAELQPLRQFILPGGAQAAAALHIARTVSRRAERRVVALAQREHVDVDVLTYLNRLSDLLFVLARAANARSGTAEPVWTRE